MRFLLRPITEADHERMVAIINAQVDSPTTLEEFQRQEAVRPKEMQVYRLAGVTEAGVMAGFGTISVGPLNRPGEARGSVRVEAPYQKQGLGGQLYAALEEWGQEHGATFFHGFIREADAEAVAWAERRGFRKAHHLFKSTLTLKGFDPSPFIGALEQARSEGFRFLSLAELPAGDETYRLLYDFYEATGRDIPGQEDTPEIPYDLFKRALVENPRFDPAAVHVAVDGDHWAALCHLIRQYDGGYFHQFTGVRREYRGRGLSLAVKVAGLQWAMAAGVERLQTYNHSNNQRMLAVNRKMGYVPEPGSFEVRKDLD